MDEGVAILASVLARRSEVEERSDPLPRGRRPVGHRAGPGARAGRSSRRLRRCWPAGRGPGVREAVRPDPQLQRGGRLPARRPPGDHPGRRSGLRPPGDGGGRRPHPGPVPRRHRRPGLRPQGAGAHGGRVAGAGDQPALRRGPSVPGPGRPADPAAALGPPGRPHGRLGRRRQQRVPQPHPGGVAVRHGRRVACPPGYEPDPGAVDVARGRGIGGRTTAPAEAVRAPTPSTPTSGSRWARRPRQRTGARRSAATRSTAGDGAGGRRRRVPALPARPPGRGGRPPG